MKHYFSDSTDDETCIPQEISVGFGFLFLCFMVELISLDLCWMSYRLIAPLGMLDYAIVAISIFCAVVTCLYRLFMWDTRRWDWRGEPFFQRGCFNARIWSILSLPVAAFGVLTGKFLSIFIRNDTILLIPLTFFTYFALVCVWIIGEVIRHMWHYSTRS